MAEVKLSNVRLSFPDLFVATEFEKGDGKARYNASFLVEPGSPNALAIENAISKVAEEKWPKKGPGKVNEYRGNANKFCYLNGDTKDYDGYKGMMVLSSHRKASDGRPYVVDRNKQPLTAADGKPYAGCFVNAAVQLWAQDGTNSGIRCSLLGVQFVKDGDAFSGAGRANEGTFDDLGVEEDTSDLG